MEVCKSTDEWLYGAVANILGARTGVRMSIYISTASAVYPELKRLPVEEDDTVNPECQHGVRVHAVEGSRRIRLTGQRR